MSMIKAYKECLKKKNKYRMKNCPWFFFFNKRDSLQANRLRPWGLLEKLYKDPGTKEYKQALQEFIDSEWYEEQSKENYFSLWALNDENMEKLKSLDPEENK